MQCLSWSNTLKTYNTHTPALIYKVYKKGNWTHLTCFRITDGMRGQVIHFAFCLHKSLPPPASNFTLSFLPPPPPPVFSLSLSHTCSLSLTRSSVLHAALE